MQNLASLVDIGLRHGPDRPVFTGPTGEVSYGQFAQQIATARARLASLGVRKGDRVAIGLAFAPDFAVAFYATLGLGAIAVPMNTTLTPREARYYLEDSGAGVMVAPHDIGQSWASATDVTRVDIEELGSHPDIVSVDAIPDVDGSETAVILYTSGTTGTPKGAELTYSGLWFQLLEENLADPAVVGPLRDEVVMGVLPLFHTMGVTVLNLTIQAGAAMWPVKKFDPRTAAEALASGRIDVFVGVPTHVQMLLAASEDLMFTTPVRRLVTAGAALTTNVREAAEQRLGTPVIDGYGLTEASPAVAFNRDGIPIRDGSVGQVLPGVELHIVGTEGTPLPTGDIGEIVLRGPNVMKGYWHKPEATQETIVDGWLKSGDVGRLDNEGNLYIVDRLKQIIIRGGYNVYPGEVEAVLNSCPGVVAGAVTGMPDERVGEEIVALVVCGEGADEERLRWHMSENLAPYKTPRHYVFVDALPRTATGKIARAELAALLPEPPTTR